MQDNATSSPAREKRQAKSCCLLALTVGIACFLLILSGIACVIILDSISLRGEEHTLSWRVKRYKAASQFLWFDFKDWLSRKDASDPQIISCPVEPQESEPGPEAEPEL